MSKEIIMKAVKGAVFEVNTKNAHFKSVKVVIIPKKGDPVSFELYGGSPRYWEDALYVKGNIHTVWEMNRKGLCPMPQSCRWKNGSSGLKHNSSSPIREAAVMAVSFFIFYG